MTVTKDVKLSDPTSDVEAMQVKVALSISEVTD